MQWIAMTLISVADSITGVLFPFWFCPHHRSQWKVAEEMVKKETRRRKHMQV